MTGSTTESDRSDAETEHSFPFEAGDNVLVRVRENGTTGRIEAKMELVVDEIRQARPHGTATAIFDPPWGRQGDVVRMKPYEAEFEVMS